MKNVIILDLDGTACLHGERNIFDESRVSEDLPNTPVIELVKAMKNNGYGVVVITGRHETCYRDTVWWLDYYGISDCEEILMRSNASDKRQEKDNDLKRRLYNEHIKDRYNVLFVVEDRSRVVKMWRELGLTVLQCADGDY